ncbi:MAG: hydantoinase/oxoprolinase family protein [Gammaproteobacteria bacterium]|nr:hydantoinase/oxoprolinase family protein [Gammaproteobacteria bacterium]
MGRVRVAVDIGGTFTDICILDEDTHALRVLKLPSSQDPIDAALDGLTKAGLHLADVSLFAHGTTVATNALIQRNLPPTAMVVTAGFRDVIEIGNSTKEDLWDAYRDNPPPYIRRRDRLPIAERTDASGKVEQAIDPLEARTLASKLRKRGYQSVAICFMNSFANAANEKAMKTLLQQELPGVAICTSAEVLPEIFEHDRFSTTVINAVLRPVVGEYALRLQERLKQGGYRSDVLLLHSGGGVMTPKSVDTHAARLASSGIAAGAIANRYIGQLCGFPNSIGFDMGGTSTDVSLAWQGQLTTTRDWHIEYGHPVCFPSIDIKTIGAGGGSIAWIDEAGSLRNGPQSAGASPGPACYGRGGENPTNTDANLVLGRLDGSLVGGDLKLDVKRAITAIESKIARPLGMDLISAARAIIKVANGNMSDAIRLVSIMRGYDPRDFALVAFGGAGALHGAALARDLSIPSVIVPPHPGVTSALGCLLVDIRHDLLTTFVRDASSVDPHEIDLEFQKLEAEARERLHHEGVGDQNVVLQRTIDMRYQGQWRSLSVPASTPFIDMHEAIQSFSTAHQREYHYQRVGAGIEVFRLSLTAIGLTPKAELAKHVPRHDIPVPYTKRPVIFDEDTCESSIYQRDDLHSGARFSGPAVVQQLDATTVVPPGVSVTVDPWLNLIMTV